MIFNLFEMIEILFKMIQAFRFGKKISVFYFPRVIQMSTRSTASVALESLFDVDELVQLDVGHAPRLPTRLAARSARRRLVLGLLELGAQCAALDVECARLGAALARHIHPDARSQHTGAECRFRRRRRTRARASAGRSRRARR